MDQACNKFIAASLSYLSFSFLEPKDYEETQSKKKRYWHKSFVPFLMKNSCYLLIHCFQSCYSIFETYKKWYFFHLKLILARYTASRLPANQWRRAWLCQYLNQEISGYFHNRRSLLYDLANMAVYHIFPERHRKWIKCIISELYKMLDLKNSFKTFLLDLSVKFSPKLIVLCNSRVRVIRIYSLKNIADWFNTF